MAQKVREVMTANPVTISPDTTVAEAAKRMRDEGIGDVLVLEGDELRGILTDRDIVTRVVAGDQDTRQVTAGEACSGGKLVCLSPDDRIGQAVKLMTDKAVRRLPVVEDGRPVGMVSLGDLAIERDPDSALADISAAPDNG